MINLETQILDYITSDWRKIAFVIGSVLNDNQKLGIFLNEDLIHEEIKNLIQKKVIDSQGDTSQMRYSEIKLNIKST